jgi:hypothetical protein
VHSQKTHYGSITKKNFKIIFSKIIAMYCENNGSRNSSVGIATGYWLDGLGSIPGRGAQPSVQWVPVAISQEVKRQVREADQSTPSGASIKNWELYLHSPICLQGQVYLFIVRIIQTHINALRG